MATKSVKTTRPTAKKTSAPKVSRARTAEEAADGPSHEHIAIRAYELWCGRGYQHGHDVEDWLAAEHELAAR